MATPERKLQKGMRPLREKEAELLLLLKKITNHRKFFLSENTANHIHNGTVLAQGVYISNDEEGPYERAEKLKYFKERIEAVTGDRVIDELLKAYLNHPGAERELERAIQVYPAVSQSMLKIKDIVNPVGLTPRVGSTPTFGTS